MKELKMVKLAGKEWFIDERLNQARNIKNPFEFMSIDEFNTLLVIESNLKGGKE